MSEATAPGTPWVLVPRGLNTMLADAEAELRTLADANAQDTARITRAKAHVAPVEVPAFTVASRDEFDALAGQGAAFDEAERGHEQAVAALARAQASLAGAQAEQTQRIALMGKAKMWRLALVVVFAMLVVMLVW